MGGGDGGIHGQAGFPLETWFWEMPLCTRWWTTATVLTSALVQCQIVTPFQLFYSFRAVFVKSQVGLNHPYYQYVYLTISTVLAPHHDLHLLWSSISRSRLPRFLSYKIFTATRGVIWAITSALFMAIALCNYLFNMSLSIGIHAIPWPSSIFDIGLYMVETESRYAAELLGSACLYSTVSTMGVDGL